MPSHDLCLAQMSLCLKEFTLRDEEWDVMCRRSVFRCHDRVPVAVVSDDGVRDEDALCRGAR
jgi:hypothetical protein